MLFSHNKMCDVKHWTGEAKLEGFEEFVLGDEVVQVPILESYETAIDNFWPLFIADMALE